MSCDLLCVRRDRSAADSRSVTVGRVRPTGSVPSRIDFRCRRARRGANSKAPRPVRVSKRTAGARRASSFRRHGSRTDICFPYRFAGSCDFLSKRFSHVVGSDNLVCDFSFRYLGINAVKSAWTSFRESAARISTARAGSGKLSLISDELVVKRLERVEPLFFLKELGDLLERLIERVISVVVTLLCTSSIDDHYRRTAWDFNKRYFMRTSKNPLAVASGYCRQFSLRRCPQFSVSIAFCTSKCRYRPESRTIRIAPLYSTTDTAGALG